MRLIINHRGIEYIYSSSTSSINTEFHLREIFEIEAMYIENETDKKQIDIRKPETWILLLNNNFITHDYKDATNYIKDYLLQELKFSKVEIPLEVIDVIFNDGRNKGFYKNPSIFLSCCHNRNSVVYFLNRGYKFKQIKGYGNSTMEYYFYPKYPLFLDRIMCYPKALDKKWIKKNKQTILDCIITLAQNGEKEIADWVGQLLI